MQYFLSLAVREVLFIHWSVSAASVRRQLPDILSLDTHDGTARLGIVALQIENARPRGFPIGLSFAQLNVRTYVTHDGERGVFFFSLDAADRLGVTVARKLFRLPYFRAETHLSRHGDERVFHSHRIHSEPTHPTFDATFRPTDESVQNTGSILTDLVERYRLYTTDTQGRLYTGTVEHDPWPLRRCWADIHQNDYLQVNGLLSPDDDPLVHYSEGVDFRAGRVRRVTSNTYRDAVRSRRADSG